MRTRPERALTPAAGSADHDLNRVNRASDHGGSAARTVDSSDEAAAVAAGVKMDSYSTGVNTTGDLVGQLDAALRLRIVARHGAGTDNIDLECATRMCSETPSEPVRDFCSRMITKALRSP